CLSWKRSSTHTARGLSPGRGGIEASFAQTPHIVDDGADGLPIQETYYSAVRLEQLLILWCALRRVLARNGSFSPHQAEDVKNTEFSIVNRALEVGELDVGQHAIGEGFEGWKDVVQGEQT